MYQLLIRHRILATIVVVSLLCLDLGAAPANREVLGPPQPRAGDDVEQRLRSVEKQVREEASSQILEQRAESIGRLRAILNDEREDWNVRGNAAYVLGEMRATEAAEDLVRVDIAA